MSARNPEPADRSTGVGAEFQRRRLRTWQVTRGWLLAAIASGVVFGLGITSADGPPSGTRLLVLFVSFVGVCIAMIVAIRRLSANYRCPRCDSLPMTPMRGGGSPGGGFSYRSGVDLNPSTCPKCGASLRP